jgi:3'(2'), 5'-bisphosphate nucleotidase
MSYYRTGLPVEHKAGDEPVTVADRVADDQISAGLRAAFPADGVLTEESDDDPSRLEKERVWIVDPLDGTTEFIAETGDFVVQIGLAVAGQPVLGVVYQPTTDRLFFAVRGHGAYSVCNGQSRKLQVSNVADPARMRLVVSRSHYSSFVEAARLKLGIQSVRRVGSVGLKAEQVARGVCDLYLGMTVAKEWDICAPHALLSEAGGVLTNLCGQPMTYNKPGLLECRGLVGSNGMVHDEIVESLASLRRQPEG